MRILHINGQLSGGGVEQYLSQLLKELTSRGIYSCFVYGEKNCKSISLEDVRTYYIPGITRSKLPRQKDKLRELRKIIDDENVDLVYIHQLANPSVVKLITESKPSVKFVHDLKLICPDGSKTLKSIGRFCSYPLGYRCQVRSYLCKCMPRNLFLGLPLISHAKKISYFHRKQGFLVVASEFMKSVLVYNGFHADRVQVIPYFTYLPDSPTKALVDGDPIVLTLGRIVRDKGMHVLLAALPALKKAVRLFVVGDGPALPDLKSTAKKLEISSRVSFLGWLSHDKLDRLYRQCSLVVVPSVWPEPFGIVGIEGMAYQKPVVAYDVGGISEWLIDGVTGFLVRPSDERKLAERINLLLERPDMAEKMGKSGREVVNKRFGPETHLQALISLFERAVTNFTPKQ